jgi:uncharacterized protein YukE
LTLAASLSAQAPDRAAASARPGARSVVPVQAPLGDSVPSSWELRAHSDSAYIALLERLNDQLGWRWNPINVTVTLMAAVVAVLGLVFAGGTVMAAVMLYRQSREFREQSELSIREHRAVLSAIVETWRRETDAAFEAKMAEYDQSINEQQAKLDRLTGGSTEQREQLQRDIDRLKRERDAASAIEMEKLGAAGTAAPAGRRSQQIATGGGLPFTGEFRVPGRRVTGFVGPERRFCTTCGQEFLLPEPPAGTGEHPVPGTREVFCTRCGARNRV